MNVIEHEPVCRYDSTRFGDELPARHVFVAAYDAPIEDRRLADFVCQGNHDEFVFEAACRLAATRSGASVRLSEGQFRIANLPEMYGVSIVGVLG